MTGVPLNIDWQQIMLHLFNFTILFGTLYILLYKPVKNFIAKRENYFRELSEKAEASLAEAEREKQLYDDIIDGIDAKTKESKDKTRAELEEMRTRSIKEARAEAEQIISDAREEAEREKNKIICSAQKDISELVTDATEKLVLQQSSGEAFDQFLDAVEEAERG